MLLYYTHNSKPRGFMDRCYDYHRAQAERVGQSFRAVVREPFRQDDIQFDVDESLPRFADIYQRILYGLGGVPDKEPVFLCEDDTLYPDCRYDHILTEPKMIIFNLNLVYLGEKGFTRYMDGGIALSQVMGTAEAVRFNVRHKLAETLRGEMACIEPCSCEGKPYSSGTCRLSVPSIDFRTGHNASWNLPDGIDYFDQLEGWPRAGELWKNIYEGSK